MDAMDEKALRRAALIDLLTEMNATLDDLQARIDDAAAEVAEIDGDELRAKWRRLTATAWRSRTAEDHAAAHAAWITFTATEAIESGRVVDPGDYCAAEVKQEMDRIRGVQRADRRTADLLDIVQPAGVAP